MSVQVTEGYCGFHDVHYPGGEIGCPKCADEPGTTYDRLKARAASDAALLKEAAEALEGDHIWIGRHLAWDECHECARLAALIARLRRAAEGGS